MRNNLAKRQLGMLVFFIPSIFKLAMLPGMLAEEMGRDVWFAILLMAIAEFAQVFFIVQALKLGGLQKLKEVLGRPLYLLLTLPLLLVFAVKMVVYLAEAINYVSTFLFYNTQKANLTVLLMLVVGYLAISGINTMGRLSELLVWALPCILLIGLLFGEIRLFPEFLSPVLAHGFGPVAGGIGKYIMWAFDLTPLLFCKLNDPHPKRPLVWIGGGLCLVGVVIFYLLFIMNYGDSAPFVEHAFASLAAFNVVNTEIGSIDWPTITLWLATMVVALALKCYGAGKIGEGMKLPYRVGVTVFAVVVTALSLFAWDNLEKGIQLGTSWIKYPVVIIDVVVPVVAFILLKVHTKKEKGAELEPNQASEGAEGDVLGGEGEERQEEAPSALRGGAPAEEGI